MKKVGVFVVLFLLLFSIAPAFAAENDTDNTTDTTDTSSTTSSSSGQQDTSKGIEEGFKCLEEKAKDCSNLDVEEIALTILATPDNIFDDCVDELESRKKSDHWVNIKDTSLAILALKHAGKNTETSEKWLISQNRTPTDLTWYLEQDSNEETECHIGYDGKDNIISIAKNKKIDSNAGSCLTRAQSNFWLQVSSNCFDQEFKVECNKDFIATLLYKNKQSATIYVLEGTETAPAFGSISLSVKSKCFGSGSCDYEATAWATLALLYTGHNVEEYIPYIIAMSDTNERYLPASFIYMLTNYEDYATQLVADQKLGNYWEAKQSANNRYYDTALALIALGTSSSEQVTKAKDWLLFSQSSSNGCWNNNVKDTAAVLWALAGRAGRTSSGDGVTYCSEANYFCIAASECPSTEDVGNNYFCASLSNTCCISENLKTCSEYGGSQCANDKVCVGNSKKATDAMDGSCCTGTCEDRPTETQCEEKFYTCMDSCSEFQESVPEYTCNGAEVCCKTKTDDPDPGSSILIWVLILLILAVIGAIGWVKREQVKLYWFQLKTKFKKDKGKGSSAPAPSRPGPRGPPRPGFPPVRRPRPPVATPAAAPIPPTRRRRYDRRDSAMSETFKKLRDMSG